MIYKHVQVVIKTESIHLPNILANVPSHVDIVIQGYHKFVIDDIDKFA